MTWLLWPEAVAWMICKDHIKIAEIGAYFRQRMATNQSADIVYEIQLSLLPQQHVGGPIDGGEKGAQIRAEEALVDMMEADRLVGEGRPKATASPVRISANEWRDAIVRPARTFEMQERQSGKTKFWDIRVLAEGLPGWDHAQITGSAAGADHGDKANGAFVISVRLTDEELASWADDAVSRNVSIAGARADAKAVLKYLAPTQDVCRSALKAARDRRGIETKAGRPTGSKSFSKAATKT